MKGLYSYASVVRNDYLAALLDLTTSLTKSTGNLKMRLINDLQCLINE